MEQILKSPTQEKLEAQRHQDIRDIVMGTLEKYRGRRNMQMLVAVDLEVTYATVYRWCAGLGIDINEYRQQPEPAAQEVTP